MGCSESSFKREVHTNTGPSQETKKSKKNDKKAKKEELAKERAVFEKKIDALLVELKTTKDKFKKKEIKKEIKELKYKRSLVGKKDTFLGDVNKEMRLVRWPKKEEIAKYAIASLIFVLFFALFFYGIDALFALVKGWIS